MEFELTSRLQSALYPLCRRKPPPDHSKKTKLENDDDDDDDDKLWSKGS